MSYGEKYCLYTYWDHNSDNTLYKLSILVDGYASTVTTLTPTENPLMISCHGQRDSADAIIFGSELSFSFIAAKASVAALDADFLELGYKDALVKLIADPAGTPVVKWVGYLKNENNSREFYGTNYRYELEATDAIADLKNYSYSSDGTINGSRYTGFEDMLTIIKTALSKFATITELQLSFRVQLGTYSDQMADTENAFKENEIPQELFSEIADGGYKYDDCYTVIEKILAPFNCTFKQSDGYYWIVNTAEQDSYYFEYNWALVQQSRTASDLVVDATDYNFFGKGQLYKVPPLKYFVARLYNKDYTAVLITNGSFDANITGWTNGDADNNSNAWDSIAWYDYPLIGGTLGATKGGGAFSGTFSFHYGSALALDVGAGSNTVAVSWSGELYSETRTGGASAIPLVKARIWNATDGYIDGTQGQQPFISVGGFYSFSETFDLTSFTVANNYLDIQVEVQDNTTTAIQLYFDNIGLTQLADDEPQDWYYFANASTSMAIDKKEQILYIADQQESVSDICSIKDAGGTYTSTWDRYGDSDDLPLIKILLQQKLNAYNRHINYVKATIYDPTETIFLHKFIELNSIVYRILGMEKDYREGAVQVDLIESNNTDVTAGFNTGYKLSTKYGKEI